MSDRQPPQQPNRGRLPSPKSRPGGPGSGPSRPKCVSFRDDTVDAGEIGAGHTVTALYEIKLHRKLKLFRMSQLGLTRRDLEPYIGTRARVAEILNRTRYLTLAMIRRLHEGLGIPAEALIQPTRRKTA